MNLYIDTTKPLQATVKINDKEIIKNYQTPQEQNILSAIDEILKTNSIELKDLKNIEVNPGPGSFTGSRVGVAIANALAFALNIPVNGKNPPIAPIYSEEPHITKPKDK